MKRELVQRSLKSKNILYSSPNATLPEILKNYLRRMLPSLSGNMTACLRFTVFFFFSFNHIVKHWYHVLHDTLHCLLHRSYSSKGGQKVFFTPSFASFPLSLASSGFLHQFTRYTDEEIPPSLASHLKSRTHLKCTAVWNASIICLTCLKLIG